jgi:hypothetical protein
LTSVDKIKEWFENRQQDSDIQRPSKAFLLDIYKPCEGQTEDELEAEIHKKDTEQILKNSQAFYEKFLKFAETDFSEPSAKIPDDNSEDSGDEMIITESQENAEREEEKRLDAEMDKTTEMFRDYLKSCDNSNLSLDEIDKALNKFSANLDDDGKN